MEEVATNAPTLFYAYVHAFVDAIWTPLRDPKSPTLREFAAKALAACLKVISERENRFQMQWYKKLYEETQKGFGKLPPPELIHASLLATGAMLENCKDFLKTRYLDICRTVLKYKGKMRVK